MKAVYNTKEDNDVLFTEATDMLTQKELALLYAKSIRDLKLEIRSLEEERVKCFNLYRRRWIDTRIANIQEIVNIKYAV